jgi:hypothetical protein
VQGSPEVLQGGFAPRKAGVNTQQPDSFSAVFPPQEEAQRGRNTATHSSCCDCRRVDRWRVDRCRAGGRGAARFCCQATAVCCPAAQFLRHKACRRRARPAVYRAPAGYTNGHRPLAGVSFFCFPAALSGAKPPRRRSCRRTPPRLSAATATAATVDLSPRPGGTKWCRQSACRPSACRQSACLQLQLLSSTRLRVGKLRVGKLRVGKSRISKLRRPVVRMQALKRRFHCSTQSRYVRPAAVQCCSPCGCRRVDRRRADAQARKRERARGNCSGCLRHGATHTQLAISRHLRCGQAARWHSSPLLPCTSASRQSACRQSTFRDGSAARGGSRAASELYHRVEKQHRSTSCCCS